MRFLIISDIHSNLEALAAVFLELHVKKEHIDQILMLGDIVGYGVNPNECCTIIKFLKSGKPTLKEEIQSTIQSIDINAADKENIINYIFSLGKLIKKKNLTKKIKKLGMTILKIRPTFTIKIKIYLTIFREGIDTNLIYMVLLWKKQTKKLKI